MINESLPTSTENHSRNLLMSGVLAGVTALSAMGLLIAPQLPVSRDMVPVSVQNVSDTFYDSFFKALNIDISFTDMSDERQS